MTMTLLRGMAALGALSLLSACGGGGGGNDNGNGNTERFSVSGSVSGLAGSGLVLQNNGADSTSVSANGAFTFATTLARGTPYNVTVATQPTSPSQTCTVSSGAGTLSANVSNVAITCATNSYPVQAAVSGLQGSGLVLQNNGGVRSP